MGTSFTMIYDRFFAKITDDMYMVWTEEETEADLENILMDAIPGFEFPRFPLYDYDLDAKCYNVTLTSEEINLLAILMYNVWLQRQIASVENIRMKYSGNDFKMTSQANHLSKLLTLKSEAERQDRHYQRLYKRRKLEEDGTINANHATIMETGVYGTN